MTFGIQQMTSELTDKGHRLYKVNGRPVLVRGGGWASDMLLRPDSPQRLEAQMRYVKEMGLNTIRTEGKLESDEFYEAADRHGFVVVYPQQDRDQNPHGCWNWFLPEHQVRGAGDPAAIAATVREAMGAMSPGTTIWMPANSEVVTFDCPRKPGFSRISTRRSASLAVISLPASVM